MASLTKTSLKVRQSSVSNPKRCPSRSAKKFSVRASSENKNSFDDSDVTRGDRRAALGALVAAFSVAQPAGEALAAKEKTPPRDYYQELLENSKNKPTVSLDSYKKVKDQPVKASAVKKIKPVSSSSKPSSTTKPKPTLATRKPSSGASSAGGFAFNPVEVGIGLALAAGAVWVGRIPSKKSATATPAKNKGGTVVKKTGTIARTSPPPPSSSRPGTVRLGTTIKKAAPPPSPPVTKKPVPLKATKATKATSSTTSPDSNGGIAAIAGVGIAAVALIALTVSTPATKVPPPPPTETKAAPEVSKKIDVPEPVKAPEVKVTEEAKTAAEPAPVVPAAVAKPTVVVETPNSDAVVASKPTTPPSSPTANATTREIPTSNLVILGVGIAAFVLVALFAPKQEGEGTAATVETPTAPGSGDVPSNVADAKRWIANWRAKQQK